MRVCLAITILVSVWGCRAKQSTSELNTVATASDVIAAHEILSGQYRLGACLLETGPLKSKNGKNSIAVKLTHEAPEELYELEKSYSNHELSLSKVDVKYSRMGLGIPYRIILERVSITRVPADKFYTEIDLEDSRPVRIRHQVMNGAGWNVIKELSCP